MYTQAILTIRNYIPQDGQKNLLFMTSIDGVPSVFEKKFRTISAVDEYIENNGYPIYLAIVVSGDPNELKIETLAEKDQIGWFDDGSEDLRSVELSDINTIFSTYDGILEIYIEEDEESATGFSPLIQEGKVVIRLLNTYEEDYGDNIDADYNASDYSEMDGLEEEDQKELLSSSDSETTQLAEI